VSAVAPEAPRSAEQRKADSLAKLAGEGADVWVATASADGTAHLVPLSLCWDGDRVILATERSTTTFTNLEAGGGARLALGPERDVVMLDVVLVSVIDVAEAPHALADAYAAQADWDPRDAGDGYVYVVLAPERIQAWREADEIAGRTLMRHGRWLV
jgi:Pyridoxamine 5'-phosphate oxidase